MSDDDLGMCPCGSAWFSIVPPPDEEAEGYAAVCIDTEGSITGYAGVLACTECGTLWSEDFRFRLTNSHLRLVID